MFCIISIRSLTNVVFILPRSSLSKVGVAPPDMAGINNGLFKPLEEGDDKKNTQTTIREVQQTWNKADSVWYCRDESEEPADLECHIAVSSPSEPGLHQQPELLEMLRKRCRWFDEIEEPQNADASTYTSSHQCNRSRISPKKLFQAAKLRQKVLPTTASSLMDDESDFCPPQPLAASNNATQAIVEVSFPPGCVPSNAIVHINRMLEPQPVVEVIAAAELEHEDLSDSWIQDLCSQALSLEGPFGPEVTSASTSCRLITVHDLAEENTAEMNPLPCKMFKIFLQNPKVASRRKATCDELEMVSGFVKVNGARFSLWHLRNELKELSLHVTEEATD